MTSTIQPASTAAGAPRIIHAMITTKSTTNIAPSSSISYTLHSLRNDPLTLARKHRTSARQTEIQNDVTARYELYMKAVNLLEHARESDMTAQHDALVPTSNSLDLPALDALHIEILLECSEMMLLYPTQFTNEDIVSQLEYGVDILTRSAVEDEANSAAAAAAQQELDGKDGKMSDVRSKASGRSGTSRASYRTSGGAGGATKRPSSKSGTSIRGGGASTHSQSPISPRSSAGGLKDDSSAHQNQHHSTTMPTSHLLLLLRLHSLLFTLRQTVQERISSSLLVSYYTERVWSRVGEAVAKGFFGRGLATAGGKDKEEEQKENPTRSGSAHGGPKRASGSGLNGFPMSPSANATTANGGKKSKPATPLAAGAVVLVNSSTPSGGAAPAASTIPYITIPRTSEEWLIFSSLPKSIMEWLNEQTKEVKNEESTEEGSATSTSTTTSPWFHLLPSSQSISPTDLNLLTHTLLTTILPFFHKQGFVLQTIPLLRLIELVSGEDGLIRKERMVSCVVWVEMYESMKALGMLSVMKQMKSEIDSLLIPNEQDKDSMRREMKWYEDKQRENQILIEQKEQESSRSSLSTSRPIASSNSRPTTSHSIATSIGTSTTRGGGGGGAGGGGGGDASSMYGADILLTTESILAQFESFVPGTPQAITQKINRRLLYLRAMEYLISEGMFSRLKSLLIDGGIHAYFTSTCGTNNDPESLSHLQCILSQLAYHEGALPQALSLQHTSFQTYFGAPNQWLRGVRHFLMCLTKYQTTQLAQTQQQRQAYDTQTMQVLMRTKHVFTLLLQKKEYVRVRYELKVCIAEILHELVQYSQTKERYLFGWQYQIGYDSLLSIPFAAAAEVGLSNDSVLSADRGDRTTTRSAASSARGSTGGASDGGGAASGSGIRGMLSSEHQSLWESVWNMYEQGKRVWWEESGDDSTTNTSDASNDITSSLSDPFSYAQLLLSHSSSLYHYSLYYSYPASEVLTTETTISSAMLEELLQRVTKGTNALHQAVRMLEEAERIITERQVLVSSGATGLLPSYIGGSLPVQRQLAQVKHLLAQVFMELYRFKKPERRYEEVESNAGGGGEASGKTGKVHVLNLGSLNDANGGASDRNTTTILSFADPSDTDAQQTSYTSHQASIQLSQAQASMNSLFFSKYPECFGGEEEERKRNIIQSPELMWNERAVHLAASAVSVGTVVNSVGETTGGSTQQLTTLVSSLSSSPSNSSSSSISSSPLPYYTLGLALNSLHTQYETQRAYDASRKEANERNRKEQEAWREKVRKEMEGGGNIKEANKPIEEQKVQVIVPSVQVTKLTEAEAVRDTTASPDDGTAGGTSKRKKRSRKKNLLAAASATADGDQQVNGENGEIAANGNIDPSSSSLPPLPTFANYSYDTSSWSPAHLSQHILHARSLALRDNEEDGVSGGGGGSGAGPGGMLSGRKKKRASESVRGKKMAAEEGNGAPPASSNESSLHPLPLPTTLQGQSLLTLHHCLHLCLRRLDTDLTSLSTLSSTAFALADIYGTMHPLLSARYLTLATCAQMRETVANTVSYLMPNSVDALLLTRLAHLTQRSGESDSSSISSNGINPELEKIKIYLTQYSEVWKATSWGGWEEWMEDVVAVTDETANAKPDPSSDLSSFTQQGSSWYSSLLSSLPSGTITLTLEYNTKSSVFYALIQGSGITVPLITRVSLSSDKATEWNTLLHTSQTIQNKISRTVLLHGSSSSSSQLNALERMYAAFLNKLDTFMEKEVWERLHIKSLSTSATLNDSTGGGNIFSSKDIVLLMSSPTLWTLPLESLSVFQTAASVTRDFTLPMFVGRVRAQQQQQQSSSSSASSFTINPTSLSFIVDAGAEDESLLSDPHIVGTQTANVTTAAKVTKAQNVAKEQAERVELQQKSVVEKQQAQQVSERPTSPSSSAVAPVAAQPRKKVSKATNSVAAPSSDILSLVPNDSLDADPFTQGDMVRVFAELRALILGESAAAAGGRSSSSSSASWMGVSGDAHTPVQGEWLSLLQHAARTHGAFVYLGYESFLTRLTPQTFGGIGVLNGSSNSSIVQTVSKQHQSPHLQALLLFDRSICDRSFRWVSAQNSSKSSYDRVFESAFFTALLSSLQGIPTITLHTHAISSHANTASLKLFTEQCVLEGKTLGQAVRVIQTVKTVYEVKADPDQVASMSMSIPSYFDLLPYLDHAVWSENAQNERNRAKILRAGGRIIAAAHPSLRTVSRPLVSTHLRDLTASLPARGTAARAARHQRSGSNGGAGATNANFTAPTQIAVTDSPIRWRLYDKYNLVCVGLPSMRIQ